MALLAAARRYAPPKKHVGLEFLQGFFDKQQEVYDCGAQFIALQCGRRAGKTDLLAKTCLESMCTYPGANEWTGYITLTKGQSRRNLAGVLQELIDAYGLPITHGEVDGQIVYTHDNGHRLWLGGVDDLRKIERWRGNKWRRVFIDEAGAMPNDVLVALVQVVLKPALSDYGGTLWISGSPGPIEKGFFHDITTGKNPKVPQWKVFHWNCLDNPFHPYGQPGGRVKLDEYRVSEGWGLDDSTFVREWLGLWCTDSSAIIYPYEPDRNAFLELPRAEPDAWRWVLGVDVGHDDDTAFVLSCSRSGFPQRYITRAWGAPEMTQPQRAAALMRTRAELVKAGFNAPAIAFDTGGLGKALAHDLTETYGVFIDPAMKWDKNAAVRKTRGALTSGLLFIHRDNADELVQEYKALPWDDKRHEHHPKYPDHRADAALYSLRPHWVNEAWDEEPPIAGSRAAIDAEGTEHKRRLERIAELTSQLRSAQDNDERFELMERIEAERRVRPQAH